MCTATVAARGDAAVRRSGEVTGAASGRVTASGTRGRSSKCCGADRAIRAATLPSGFSLSDLRSVDELPFTYAINADVDMVMTSWATYAALDPDLPSGLSPRIVRGELRGRLKFGGVTITDAIEAGALQSFGDTGERAVAAAAAGMDIVLCSARSVSQGQDAVVALQAAVADGQLDRGAAIHALQRVIALRGPVG